MAQEAAATGRTVRENVMARGLMSEEQLDSVLDPEALAGVEQPEDESP